MKQRRRKPGVNKRKKIGSRFKYGLEVPHTYEDDIWIDSETDSTYWKDANEKKMAALIAVKCFKFLPLGTKRKG